MKKAAIEKSQLRLEKARAALDRARDSASFEEFESSWTDFLISLNAIPVVLERGARSVPKNQQWWFSKKKPQINDDPLLCYLHQARNVDEHGLEPTTARLPGGIGLGRNQDVYIEHMSGGPQGVVGRVHTLGGEPLRVGITPPHCRLVAVTDDRFGTTFEPPIEHLGKPLESTMPVAVGRLALAYYEALVAEAALRL
jgi:hypothetical protein